jgi:hypothetical protein
MRGRFLAGAAATVVVASGLAFWFGGPIDEPRLVDGNVCVRDSRDP